MKSICMSPLLRGHGQIMQNTDGFERDWRDWELARPRHRDIYPSGLVLGRGTLLADFGKEGLAARGLTFDGKEARVLSLLSAAYREPRSHPRSAGRQGPRPEGQRDWVDMFREAAKTEASRKPVTRGQEHGTAPSRSPPLPFNRAR